MPWYLLLTTIAFLIFLFGMGSHLIRLIQARKTTDFAVPSGAVDKSLVYSFTKAMSPAKKESAFLHLPTYSAGILYHLGTFLSILLAVILLLPITLPAIVKILVGVFLMASSIAGFGILIKRITVSELRHLSSPDDYLSNLLVTLFQILSTTVLFYPESEMLYYILLSLLLLYFPIGKLRHALFFFAARYQLALFFGKRGVWPPIKD